MPNLDDLAAELATAKSREVGAIAHRREIETAILSHPDVAGLIKDEGTLTIGPVKVVTGYTRAWDQAELEQLAKVTRPEYFPFKTEYKEDRRASRTYEERFPDLYEDFRKALTLKPKKPVVSVVERKSESA